jgi:hypothetical protein
LMVKPARLKIGFWIEGCLRLLSPNGDIEESLNLDY